MRFPVLVWEDFEGGFTASLVNESFPHSAVGETADAAVSQLKEYVQWAYKHEPFTAEPDFHDAQLAEFGVNVRPEYEFGDRIFPCDETVRVRVACVHGRQEGGLLVGSLPMLQVHFYYYEPKALKELTSHYVQEKLKGLTPRSLSRYLLPRRVFLEEIVIQTPRKVAEQKFTPGLGALSAVAEPLGDRALRKQFSRAWEREREVADLVARLTKERANVILVGETGCGKTSVLVEAVRQIEKEFRPSEDDDDYVEFADYRRKFWMTSAARLIAGMKYLGQWEERVEKVIEELSGIGGVLCIDNLLDLVRIGGEGPDDSIAAFLLPYLQNGEIRIVSEATPSEMDALRRLLPGLADVFQVLNLAPFVREKALAVLGRVATVLKNNRHIEADDRVIELVYRLFNRFAPYESFPGKTVAFLTELFDRAEVEREKRVTGQMAVRQFIFHTGLPELFLRDEIRLHISDVIAEFGNQVIGQSEACHAAANLVTTFKSGLNDPNRPVGVLLFCGPTGVGKTELARSISKFFFGHGEERDRLVRLDMSEYSGPGSASRIIAGPGGEPSELIRKMRRQPFTVVLLDEIEKAAPEVFDIFLSVFDEGRLTDRYGRTTTFRSAVIILTSNLGADKFAPPGFGNTSQPSYSAEAMSFFRPEFFNRIDAIVRFAPLDQQKIIAIAEKELRAISNREGLAKSNIRLEWTDRLVHRIARDGYDPRYGARPLQRTIETIIVAPLSRYLIDRPDLKDMTIQMDMSDEGRVLLG
jgi:ATP-dependent Clp protease ATP-binding subunit ClpC